MICQCLVLLVIIYAGDVHSLPHWIGGQIYNSPDAYRIQNNPWTSRDILSEVSIKTDAAKTASRKEEEKSPDNSSNGRPRPAYLQPEPDKEGPSIQLKQSTDSNPTNDENQPTD